MRHLRNDRPPATCALITGATGGIGAALARALPPETAVVITGRREDELARLEHELSYDRTVRAVPADLATEEGRAAVVEAAREAGVDLLVNNAGLGSLGNFADEPLEAHVNTIRVNVEAPLALIHALLPDLVLNADLAGKRAGIVNISSAVAFVPVPTLATYAATKAFLLSFGESLAAELADRPVDVLTACPGAVRTAFGGREGYSNRIPTAMSPETVAKQTFAALGRQSTVVIGPASATAFTGVAVARSLFGRAFMQANRVAERFRPS
jgi:short-subunit dehydrogenase